VIVSNPDKSFASPKVQRTAGARIALLLLLSINLFNYIDRYVLAAAVPQIRQTFFGETSAAPVANSAWVTHFLSWFEQTFRFKPENALIGLLSMAFMVVYMLAWPVFGRLADKVYRWLLIGSGVILWSLASGASGLATGFSILLLTRCFVGIGEAAYGPIAPTVISDFYPVQVRGQVLSWFYLAIPVGSAVGFIVGDQFARSALGWRWGFYSVVVPGILLGIWALLMPEPPRGMADRIDIAEKPQVRWKDYLVLARTPSYVLDTLGMAAMTFAIGGIGFWMPDYIQEFRGVAGPVATIFGLISLVAGLSGTLLGGIVGDKLRSRLPGSYFLVSGVAMLVGFPLFLVTLRAPFPLAWLFVFLACFCLFFNTGPVNTILANVTHPAIRATAFAINILVIHLVGDVISPLVIGLLADRFNMNIAFVLVVTMFLVSGVLWLCGAKHLERDTRHASGLLHEERPDRAVT